ncbi:MAG: hypothetical protein K2Q10_02560, partial [Rhodospirillales bacterium]|nr:hypothetical protein [Rhodospirillales bacterium]
MQVDGISTYSDGSIRQAVVSVAAPADLAAGGALDLMLGRGPAAASGGMVDPVGRVLDNHYDLAVNLDLHNADGSISHLAVNAADAMRQALSDGKVDLWMKGPLATEMRVSAHLNDQLTATFDIRVHANGEIRTDVSVHYDWAYDTPMRNVTYDLAVTQGGQAVLSETNLSHNHHANWHTQVWSNGQPGVNVVHDPAYLEKSGAVPAYDLAQSLNAGPTIRMAGEVAAGTADVGPMGHAYVQEYMPMTGERADIGVLPTWAAQAVLQQTAQAQSVLFANADAAGAVPWHFRSEATGRMTTLDEHPRLWIEARGNNGRYGDDALTQGYETKVSTGWTPDTAHAPALTSLAYLLSGDRYYLNELQSQANYAMLSVDPDHRGNAGGLLEGQQLRGEAWSLRSLGDAAALTPDTDTFKGYFGEKLDNNLSHYVQSLIVERQMAATGQLEG